MKIGKREIKGKRVINWEIPSMCATTIIPSLSAHSYPPVPLSTSTKSTNSVGGIGKKERAIQKHQRSEVEIPQVFPNKHTCTCARLRLLSAVDSLKKKDAVSAAMLRSCSIPVSSTSQTPPPVHSTLFVSRIHKPDHSYNGGEGASDYSSLKFWREGKER